MELRRERAVHAATMNVRTSQQWVHAPPRLSMYAKERIQWLLEGGVTIADIVVTLKSEGIVTCRQTVWRFKQHLDEHNSIEPLPKSGRPTTLTRCVSGSIENSMQRDDETTAEELVSALNRSRVSVSKTTVLKGRRLLGWTRRGTAYCQLIRGPNCIKRLEWGTQDLGRTFDNVIWSDKMSVQMETHRRFHCYKRGQKPRYKHRPKHPVKVQVWQG